MSGKPYGFVMDINFKLDAPRWIETLNLKRIGNDEYHGPCPNCGGTDRFWINSYHGSLRHHCRKQCDFVSRQERLSKLGLIDDSKNIEPEFRNKGKDPLPYHVIKKIKLEGSGATCDGDTLVIDLFDLTTGEWRGKQFISPDGRKKFSPNLIKENTGAFIGQKSDKLYVTEGWADAVIVHRATGEQAFFALDAGTLPSSAKQLVCLGYNVIIAADNDKAGITAAKSSGAPYALPQGGKDWWDVFDLHSLEAVAEQLQNASTTPQMQLFDHVVDVTLEPPKWLIEGILPEYAMTALVAPSYTGKSFVAVDIACAIANGLRWHDEFDVTHGNVFYVVGEGRHGIRRRVDAWHRKRGVTLTRETTNLHFSRQGLNFRDKSSIEAIKSDMRLVKNLKLIVVDTLARSFGGGNENAPQDMGEFINNCDDLMHEFGATILTVHHMGKDTQSGARGHSSFYGALDTCMTLKKVGQHDLLLKCEKQKDAPEFDDIQFCFLTLSGEDDTQVLEKVETSKRPLRPKLGINKQLALDTYMEAIKGRPLLCRLHIDEWRPFFERRHTGDTPKQKNDAFSRARRSLVSKGLMQVENDYYTLSDKATSGVIHQNVAGQNQSNGDATDTPL